MPGDDIVPLIVDALTLMDLSKFEARCRTGGAGQAPFSPRMVLTLLIYAYSHGVRSSRAIERLYRRDAGYRFIVGEDVPDHSVISRFRQRHAGRMKGVFMNVLGLCREAGLVRLGLVALDGTKVKAAASLDANRTVRKLDAEVERILAEAETTDAAENRLFGDAAGETLPADLRQSGDRLVRLKACKEKLERAAADAAAQQTAKVEAHENAERQGGRRKRGRKPNVPDPSVDPESVVNPSDPDSGIMKTRRGWVQGYNAQIVVTADQIILAADVTAEANDVRQLTPMLDRAQANIEAVIGEEAELGRAVADAGYWSEANVERQTEECELFIATRKDREQRREVRTTPSPRGRIPKNLTARGRMERKLRTRRGKEIYRQRGAMVEPVFGQMRIDRAPIASRCGGWTSAAASGTSTRRCTICANYTGTPSAKQNVRSRRTGNQPKQGDETLKSRVNWPTCRFLSPNSRTGHHAPGRAKIYRVHSGSCEKGSACCSNRSRCKSLPSRLPLNPEPFSL